ncbi:MAG: hypothetical protein IPP46_09540 [Bacteroidetes bacterium]|nr:hypothetical protein [Bacteroidota bacterium]
MPAYGRYNGSSFVIGSKAYFGLGYAPMSSDFYEYETLTDVWTPVTPAFPGGARMNATAFTLTYLHQGNSLTQGFVGGGASADNTTSQLSDFYSHPERYPVREAGLRWRQFLLLDMLHFHLH